MPDGGAVAGYLLKVGVAVIQRTAPTGIAFIRSLFKGKKVLIVGQQRAGKTTFLDYLQYGLFEDEKETAKTFDITRSARRFDVKLGRDASLELSVSAAIDVPGQRGPAAHADLVLEYNPHALIVVLDLTQPLRGKTENASANWLTEFCRRLEKQSRIKGHKQKRLNYVSVLLSKRDKVLEKKAESVQKEMSKILTTEFREARGKMENEIIIIPCSLVTNPEGTKSVYSAIAHLAKSLAK